MGGKLEGQGQGSKHLPPPILGMPDRSVASPRPHSQALGRGGLFRSGGSDCSNALLWGCTARGPGDLQKWPPFGPCAISCAKQSTIGFAMQNEWASLPPPSNEKKFLPRYSPNCDQNHDQLQAWQGVKWSAKRWSNWPWHPDQCGVAMWPPAVPCNCFVNQVGLFGRHL